MSAERCYYKLLTREGPLVVFEYESAADEAAYRAIGMPSHLVPGEAIVNDHGLVSCYWRLEADAEYEKCLCAKANTDPEFLLRLFDEYRALLDQHEAFLHLGRTCSRAELLEALDALRRSSEGLFYSYCLPTIEGAPKHLRDISFELRCREDQIGHGVRDLIEENIVALYPDQPLARYATANELFSDNIPSEEILQARSREFLIVDGKLLSESWKAFLERTQSEVDETIIEPSTSEFKGAIAHTGIVRGIVRVLVSRAQVNQLCDGEILVAGMTTPDFLPAMKRASAVITDEGGITCHAAIVAREMKIPCIIGTKVATQILKDGDEVEVDAEKGVVRILKRAS